MQTQFGNWAIALGIDWTMPADAREARAEKKKHPKESSVLMHAASGQRWLGFHPAVQDKVYAGALLVAMVKPNAVVYQPLNEAHAWVCAIKDGMPVPGYDKVVPASEGRKTALEWSGIFQQADMVGELAGAQGTLADVFKVLDEGLANKAIQKKQIAVVLLDTKGIPVAKVVAGAAALCVAAVAAYGVTWYLDTKESAESGNQSLTDAALRSQDQARQAAERAAAQAAFKVQVDAAREAQQVRVQPESFWSGVNRVRRSLGLSIHGYRPQTYTCTPQACLVGWNGQGRFVSQADKLRLPNVERSLTNDYAATSNFPLQAREGAMPAAPARSAEELRFLFQADLSMYLKTLTVDAVQPLTVTAPPAASLPPVVVAEVGKWRASLNGPSAVLDVAPILQRIARYPARITLIKYQPASSSVELEGEFVYLSEQKG